VILYFVVTALAGAKTLLPTSYAWCVFN